MSNDRPVLVPPSDVRQRSRQRRTIAILATLLIVGGLIVLFALTRMPRPLRIVVGLSDLIGGAVLLVVLRQKFSGK